jgi:hypothetical protein
MFSALALTPLVALASVALPVSLPADTFPLVTFPMVALPIEALPAVALASLVPLILAKMGTPPAARKLS